MPRVLQLTPEVHERMVSYVRAGNYLETAAAACGVSRYVVRDWLRRGAKGEEPFGAFAAAMHEAKALAEIRDVAIIGKAAEKVWQAAAWRRERMQPEKYGQQMRLHVDRAKEEYAGELLGRMEAALAEDPNVTLRDFLTAEASRAQNEDGAVEDPALPAGVASGEGGAAAP